jgi:hypothetical protein
VGAVILERIDLKSEKQSVLSEGEIMEVLQLLSQETACSLHYPTQHSLCTSLNQVVKNPIVQTAQRTSAFHTRVHRYASHDKCVMVDEMNDCTMKTRRIRNDEGQRTNWLMSNARGSWVFILAYLWVVA